MNNNEIINISPTQEWDTDKCVTFLKTIEEFGVFSNMAGVKVGLNKLMVAGISIRTSEHLYQACRYPDRPDIQQLILNDPSPKGAKMVAKKHDHLTHSRPDWKSIGLDVMRWAIRIKLAGNYDQLGRGFLLSGQRDIVEVAPRNSPSGRFWGAVPYGQTFVGSNIMGQLLMELRAEFKKKSREEMLMVTAPSISNFKLLGQLMVTPEPVPLLLAA